MTFTELDDAFAELERRADTIVSAAVVSDSRQPHRRSSRSLWAGVSAAAIVTLAVGIGVVASGNDSHRVASADKTLTQSTPTPRHTAAPTTTKPTVRATEVPKTQSALIARLRSILGNTGTFTVNAAISTNSLITGVLTSASGSSGMYVLQVVKESALCGSMGTVGQTATPLPCPHVTTLADGSNLKVDPNFPDGPPNGVMNDAILNRPDGWQISLYTANVEAKYYGAPVLGPKPALTIEQVTQVVTSTEWLSK